MVGTGGICESIVATPRIKQKATNIHFYSSILLHSLFCTNSCQEQGELQDTALHWYNILSNIYKANTVISKRKCAVSFKKNFNNMFG